MGKTQLDCVSKKGNPRGFPRRWRGVSGECQPALVDTHHPTCDAEPTALLRRALLCRSRHAFAPAHRLAAARRLEMVTAAMVTNLIEKGKDQGYLLSDEVVAAFPNAEDQLEILEEFYSSLIAEGIEVVDQAPLRATAKTREQPNGRAVDRAATEDLASGVGDSVRLYLQEIGDTDLLTMQEEVWLAKRMERGKLAEQILLDPGLGTAERAALDADKLDGE